MHGMHHIATVSSIPGIELNRPRLIRKRHFFYVFFETKANKCIILCRALESQICEEPEETETPPQ